MINIDDVYNMAMVASENATNALEAQRYVTYVTYVNEFNKLLKLTKEQSGEDVGHLELINMEMPSHLMSVDTKAEYLSNAALKLRQLVNYLEAKISEIPEEAC